MWKLGSVRGESGGKGGKVWDVVVVDVDEGGWDGVGVEGRGTGGDEGR